MPPKKGGNEKKEGGRAKKAENAAKKADAAAAAAERKEADKWEEGAKAKKQKDLDREAKKAADAARKAEAARLLAEEEASIKSGKPKPSTKAAGKKKVDATPAGPGAIAAGGLMASGPSTGGPSAEPEPQAEVYSATGIDDALEMLSLVTAKTDKASVGQAAAGIESHPERRFKAAFEAYKERELPALRAERPGLRLVQYQEILFKQFQKSSDNPFNQQTVAYNATKEERVDALSRQKAKATTRYRDPLCDCGYDG